MKNKFLRATKNNSSEYIFTIAVFVITPLIFLRGLFDETLISRFTFLSAFLCFYNIIYHKKLQGFFQRKWQVVDILVLGFYLIHILSVLWAANTSEAVYTSQKISLFCILYFIFKHLLREEGFFKRILLSIKILSILLIGFVGFQLTDLFFTSGFDRFTVSSVTGFSGNKNLLSGLMLLLVPLNLIGVLKSHHWRRYMCAGIFITLVIIMIILWTRSVYASFLVFVVLSLTFLLLYKFKGKIRAPLMPIFFSICVVFMIAVLVIGYSPDIISFLDLKPGSKTGTLAERLFLWDKTGDLIRNNPFLGVGAGNWKIEIPGIGFEGLQRASEGNYFFARPHNDWLQIFAETGILGICIWVGIWYTAITGGISKLSQKVDTITVVLLLSGFLGFSIFSMMSFPLERIEFIIFLALYVSLLTTHKKAITTSPYVLKHKIGFFTIILVLIANTTVGAVRIQKERQIYFVEQAMNAGRYDIVHTVVKNIQSNIYAISPNGTPTYFYEGILLLQKQEYPLAQEAFEKSLKISPYHLASHSNLALTLASQNNDEDAVTHYLRALEISPNAQEVIFQLTLVYIKIQDKENALFYANKLDDEHPKKYEVLERVYDM